MKKALISFALIVVIIVGYWLVAPLFVDRKVSEDFPDMGTTTGDAVMEPEVIARGTFSGFDEVHHGSGDATLIKTGGGYIIRFEDTFEVANGPDLFVGLGKDGEYKKEAQIAPLKGNIGSQNYSVPENINIEDYNEVWIWCRAFSVPFAKARFERLLME